MTTVTVIEQPVQTASVEQVGTQTVNIFQPGIFKITQPAIGAVDGVNKRYSASNPFDPGSIEVYINGLKERYFSLISDSEIELEAPPKNNGITDYVELIYLSK